MPIVRKISLEQVNKKQVGIQPGTTATSTESNRLDVDTRIVAKQLMEKYKNVVSWIPKLQRLRVDSPACAPDGGIFIYKNTPIFAIEAKYQHAPANAIDRWHKNHNVLRMINEQISYLTFASGRAVRDAIPISLNFKHVYEPNVDHPFWNTVYYNEFGFTVEEMFTIAERLLLATIKGTDNDEAAIYVGRWKDETTKALSTIYA